MPWSGQGVIRGSGETNAQRPATHIHSPKRSTTPPATLHQRTQTSRAKQRTAQYPETACTKSTATRTPTSSHTTQASPAMSLPESHDHSHRRNATTAADSPPPAPPDRFRDNQKPPDVQKPGHTQGTRSTTAAKPPAPTAPTPKTPPPQLAYHAMTFTPTATPAHTNAHAKRRKH